MFDEKPKMVDDPAKMGRKIPNYWDAAKRLLADPSRFLESLITFDKDNIKDAIIQRIQPYIDMEEFTPEAVARVCVHLCLTRVACKQRSDVCVQRVDPLLLYELPLAYTKSPASSGPSVTLLDAQQNHCGLAAPDLAQAAHAIEMSMDTFQLSGSPSPSLPTRPFFFLLAHSQHI